MQLETWLKLPHYDWPVALMSKAVRASPSFQLAHSSVVLTGCKPVISPCGVACFTRCHGLPAWLWSMGIQVAHSTQASGSVSKVAASNAHAPISLIQQYLLFSPAQFNTRASPGITNQSPKSEYQPAPLMYCKTYQYLASHFQPDCAWLATQRGVQLRACSGPNFTVQALASWQHASRSNGTGPVASPGVQTEQRKPAHGLQRLVQMPIPCAHEQAHEQRGTTV